MTETINHPAHYGGDTVYETIKVLRAWLPRAEYLGFLRGNAIKYQSRIGKKGEAAEDAAKAKWYGDELAKELAFNQPSLTIPGSAYFVSADERTVIVVRYSDYDIVVEQLSAVPMKSNEQFRLVDRDEAYAFAHGGTVRR